MVRALHDEERDAGGDVEVGEEQQVLGRAHAFEGILPLLGDVGRPPHLAPPAVRPLAPLQPKVVPLAARLCAHEPVRPALGDRVLDAVRHRKQVDQPQLAVGHVDRKHLILRLAAVPHRDELLVGGCADRHTEHLILRLEQQTVVWISEPVVEDLCWAEVPVAQGVKDADGWRARLRRVGRLVEAVARDVPQLVGQVVATLERDELQAVVLVALRVHAVRHHLAVEGDGCAERLAERLAFGELVAVEDDLLGAAQRGVRHGPALFERVECSERHTAVDRVLQLLLRARVVVVAAVPHLDGAVCQLHPPLHRLEERLLQTAQARQEVLAVRVLRLEVRDDVFVLDQLWPRLAAQPLVLVLERVLDARDLHHLL
mmetsp:Transcript_31222/g.91628  ORF Transcript_31222/g.91628 Transcript_31222/m.91628 type:complete len:372 (+) Transcript_31222:1483-2598(+)